MLCPASTILTLCCYAADGSLRAAREDDTPDVAQELKTATITAGGAGAGATGAGAGAAGAGAGAAGLDGMASRPE